ncbi:MAG: TonB-dependent receptor domain-containing protein [Lysobacterales bacterium]
MTIFKPFAAVFLAAGSGLLQAEAIETYQLKPDLVVTPSRKVEPLDRTLSSISVITREDIERSVAEDLFELLRLQPGVDIVRTGGAGTQTSVFLRGGNSNHVLVLVDGVRVSSANTGAYAWEQLPLNQVERVEIVRGPRGSIYGSDSIGGVIHVFTRSSPDPYARITAGSFGTAEAEAGMGYQGEATRLSVNAGYRRANGFSAQNPDGFSYNPDDDGFETANLGVKGSTESRHGRWEYSLLAIDSESEFDQGDSDARQLVSSVGFDGQLTANWHYQLQAGYLRDKLFSDFEFFTTDFKSSRYQFSWQNQLDLDLASQLSFGLDYYREDGESADTWDEDRDNVGLFAIWDGQFDRLHLQLGGRLDDNSRFGSEFTGQVGAGYDLSETWQARLSYGSAFRGPNLSEQFSPGVGGLFAGNPDLDAESSTAGEFGLRWQNDGGGRFTAAWYRTEVDDLIAYNGALYQAINIDRARLEGIELEYTLDRSAWGFGANATLQDTQDLDSGADLLRRPEQKAALRLDRQLSEDAWLGLEWFYSGERSDFGGINLDSYRLLNLRAGWAFHSDWRLELRGENLADDQYEPAYGFDAAGRSWFLSLAWLP